MGIKDLRQDLEAIRASAQAGDLARVVQRVSEALHALDGGRLLTTTEAAELLGIRSVNTLKVRVRQLGVPHEMHGNRMMLPLAEVEHLQNSPEVRGIRASDRAHDATDNLGSKEGLSSEQLSDLTQARPGRLPWQA